MRNFSAKIKRHLRFLGSRNNPAQVAGIHATILAIIMGALAVYYIFAYGEVYRIEQKAMSKAEEINSIYFIQSSYYDTNQEIFMANGPLDMPEVNKILMECFFIYGDLRVHPFQMVKKFLKTPH